jgi:hypothetical protein
MNVPVIRITMEEIDRWIASIREEQHCARDLSLWVPVAAVLLLSFGKVKVWLTNRNPHIFYIEPKYTFSLLVFRSVEEDRDRETERERDSGFQ